MAAGDWKDLYDAAIRGDIERVRYHIDADVNPNHQHPEIMCTPLVAALVHGHLDVAEHLLQHGADPNLVSDFDDLTPLQAARKHGHLAFASRLQDLGAKERRQPFWWRWLPG